MTTIAYRDGVLAADTAIFDRNLYCGEVTKIAASPNGDIGGSAGCLGDSILFLEWINGGVFDNPPEFKDEDSEGILIRADGETLWIGTNKRMIPIRSQFVALGSGFRVAMGAMAAGADAERAVRIACDIDNGTRLPVTVLKLGALS